MNDPNQHKHTHEGKKGTYSPTDRHGDRKLIRGEQGTNFPQAPTIFGRMLGGFPNASVCCFITVYFLSMTLHCKYTIERAVTIS